LKRKIKKKNLNNFTPKQQRLYQEVKYEIYDMLKKGMSEGLIEITLITKDIGNFSVMAKELIARAKSEM
jgi:hypothetical protein